MKSEKIYKSYNLCKNVIKNKKGITLVSLVITIIVMLILAGVSITVVTDEGISDSAQESKLKAEIMEIQKELNIKKLVTENAIEDGEINTVLGLQSEYNNRLNIENGKLVYKNNNWTNKEIQILEELGVKKCLYDTYKENEETIYYIANETTLEKYEGLTNIGTLANFRDLVNAGTFTYEKAILIEDIKLNIGKYSINSLGEITFTNDAEQWTPIGTSAKKFTKIFDGAGYKITGLYINDTNSTTGLNVGMFGSTEANSIIKNLGILESYIKGYQNVGGIVGNNKASIENCYVNSNISATYASVGGIAGFNEANININTCYAQGKITVLAGAALLGKVGGIVGYNKGNIYKSYNQANIINEDSRETGGIAGENYGTIDYCYNEGEINGHSNSIGGITGSNIGTITNSHNISNCIATVTALGGISGDNNGSIEKCYNTGDLQGNQRTGGISGTNAGTITLCNNSGEIIGNNINSGGIAGINSGTIEKSFNKGYVLGKNRIVGGIAGYNTGMIKQCFNKATIYSKVEKIGGIVGENCSNIINCYNIGSVEGGGTCLGGIVGYNFFDTGTPSVSNCYNASPISGSTTTSGLAKVGAIIGSNGATSTILNCYSLANMHVNFIGTDSGTTTNSAFKQTADMKQEAFLTLLNTITTTTTTTTKDETTGEDVTTTTTTTSMQDVWAADTTDINEGYPILAWQVE